MLTFSLSLTLSLFLSHTHPFSHSLFLSFTFSLFHPLSHSVCLTNKSSCLRYICVRHVILDLKQRDTDCFGLSYLQDYALKGPESHVVKDGQYDVGLVTSAEVVSDIQDSEICPDSALQKMSRYLKNK